eukprot:TRINITY_DN4883_c0_g1_i6.p1 TRINITY_DN4883_c0_g1~~TRINITY_DN4883_c0_g1_i6.p1  ORF type:complete len:208 (+),score=50.49 TRINITY_DN4883_c0_g1_i6:188-811(+)
MLLAKFIGRSTAFEHLSILGNKLTQDDCQLLSDAFKNNSDVHSFSFGKPSRYNKRTDFIDDFLEMLLEQSTLTSIDCAEFIQDSPKIFQALSSTLGRNSSLLHLGLSKVVSFGGIDRALKIALQSNLWLHDVEILNCGDTFQTLLKRNQDFVKTQMKLVLVRFVTRARGASLDGMTDVHNACAMIWQYASSWSSLKTQNLARQLFSE